VLGPLSLALLVGAGVLAGFVNVMAGGGSMLTVPALSLLGLPLDVANATSRVSIVAQSASSVWSFSRAKKIDRGDVLPVLLPAGLGALAGSLAAASVSLALLKPLLFGSMLLVAFGMLLAPRSFSPAEGEVRRDIGRTPAALAGLFVAGLYGGFTQAGVGFVLLAVLGGIVRLDLVRSNALKVVCTAVFSLVSVGVFVAAGSIAWGPALLLSVATVVGSQLGVRFTLRASERTLRILLFACVVTACLAAWLTS
jgi:uncharacterized protein